MKPSSTSCGVSGSKFDALSLKLSGKEWPEIKELLGKRYNNAIKRMSQTESEDVFQLFMNSFARAIEPHTSYLSPRSADRFNTEMNLSLEGIGPCCRRKMTLPSSAPWCQAARRPSPIT